VTTTGEGDAAEEEMATEVPALLDGVRADRAVAMLVGVPRAEATRLIGEGRVRIDGNVVQLGKSPVQRGSTLSVRLPQGERKGVVAEPDVQFEVVHADDAVIVVDKPAGLVVHPGAGQQEGTLAGGLLGRFPDLAGLVEAGLCTPDRPGIVHRLDKGTSGLMAVARTPAAYEDLVAQLATRAMGRRYLALVVGEVRAERGEVDAPIGRSSRTPTKMAVAPGGKPARTSYTVRTRLGGPRPLTLVEVALQSGRTHQIRVHMAAIGHPVVGDARYGTSDKRLGSGRFFLHAFELAFTHPLSELPLTFTSPLPADLSSYLDEVTAGAG
jgi:23S rRNA pseudouridine1911/1915/1917 synthase